MQCRLLGTICSANRGWLDLVLISLKKVLIDNPHGIRVFKRKSATLWAANNMTFHENAFRSSDAISESARDARCRQGGVSFFKAQRLKESLENLIFNSVN
jgi:hypothetical protein